MASVWQLCVYVQVERPRQLNAVCCGVCTAVCKHLMEEQEQQQQQLQGRPRQPVPRKA